MNPSPTGRESLVHQDAVVRDKLLLAFERAWQAALLKNQTPPALANFHSELKVTGDESQVAIAAHHGRVTGLALANAGRWLISSGSDGRICVWNLADQRLLREIVVDRRGYAQIAGEVLGIPFAVSADGTLLVAGAATSASTCEIQRWQLPEFVPLAAWPLATQPATISRPA